MSRSEKTAAALRVPRFQLGLTFLFQGPDRRVESQQARDVDVMVVVRTGGFHARWVQAGLDRQLEAGPGDVVFWPAGQRRTEWNDPEPRLQMIRIEWTWLQKPPALPTLVHDRHQLITHLAETLLEVRSAGDREYRTLAPSYLQAILAEYARLSRHPGDDLVGELVRFLDVNARRRFGVSELAGHFGKGRHAFTRRYKRQTGRAPMEDVRRMRVERAVTMIRITPLTLKDIAARCGLCDAAHLSRLVRRYFGATPRALRQRAKSD